MSGFAVVTENAVPEVFAVTGGGSYCSSPTATGVAIGLSSSATGISYQLYRDGTPTGSSIAGTGDALNFGNQLATGDYTVRARNTSTLCVSMMSGMANVSVNTTVVPSISMTSTLGTTVCLGSLVTFTTEAVNAGASPMYQWQVNGVNTGLGLSTFSLVPNDGDVVSVTMTSSAVCATPASVSATVTMNVSAHVMPQVLVSVMPNDTVCAGTTVTYSATDVAGGTAPFFIWKKNGVAVGAGATYSYVPENGDVVTCEMTSNFPCRLQDMVSNDTKMRVVTPAAPEVSIVANPGLSISEGQSLKLTARVANGGTIASYRWYVNGTEVSGATGSVYTSSDYQNNDEVSVEVVSGGYCAGLTGTANVVVKVSTVGVSTVAGGTDIRLFPNPNRGQFVVRGEIGGDAKEVHVDVTNMLGQVVYSGMLPVMNGKVDSRVELGEGLANGMYMLNVHTGAETRTFHFVMQQ
jgi:hypothetical protein